MHEIEVKILDVNRKTLETGLAKLGAKKVFDGDLEWVAFRLPAKDQAPSQSMLRLRKRGKKAELTFKKLLSTKRAKISEEIEVQVANYEKMKQILLAIGLEPKPGFPLKKHRTSYELKGAHFEVDTLPGIPTYLEIEAPSVAVALEYATKLGFSKHEIKSWGTREVFAHYREHQKIKHQ